jgi:hypothetical protein
VCGDPRLSAVIVAVVGVLGGWVAVDESFEVDRGRGEQQLDL